MLRLATLCRDADAVNGTTLLINVGAEFCRFPTCRILCNGIVFSLGLGLGDEVHEVFLRCPLIDVKVSTPKFHSIIYSGYQV